MPCQTIFLYFSCKGRPDRSRFPAAGAALNQHITMTSEKI